MTERAAIIAAMKHLVSLLTFAVALYVASSLPLSADAARQDKPADVAGKWALTVETAGGTGTPTVELKQDIGEGTFTGKKQ